jgi:NAD(P)-dependent dehydrogenase (short-subunit alcohol dehydrogenase family)
MAVAKRSTGITIHNDTYPFISPSRYRTSLSGKIVLVTGASRSIGRASCVAFARAGAHVAALARTASALDSLVSEITTQYGVQALAITGDVVGDAPGTIKRVEEGLGHIDILINNAGKSRMARLAEEKDFATWWRVWEVNTLAPQALIPAVLPSFLARGRGTVINVTSAAGDGCPVPVPLIVRWIESGNADSYPTYRYGAQNSRNPKFCDPPRSRCLGVVVWGSVNHRRRDEVNARALREIFSPILWICLPTAWSHSQALRRRAKRASYAGSFGMLQRTWRN